MRNRNWFVFRHSAVAQYATYCLLFLMLFIPYEQVPLKLALIGVVAASALFLALRPRVSLLDTKVLSWVLFVVSTGAFFVLWGIAHGVTDALKVLPVFVIYPIIFIFLVASLSQLGSLNGLFMLLVNSAIVISIYAALFMLAMVGIIPGEAVFSIVKEAVVSVGTEFFSYAMPSITSMLYLVPFLFSALLLWEDADGMPVKRSWLGFALILSFVPIIFSSTRVFWLILLVTPVLTYMSVFILKKDSSRTRRTVFHTNAARLAGYMFVVAILPILYFHAALTELFFSSSAFIDALTFSDAGTSVRGEQFSMLIDGWLQVPLFGAGHGASLPLYRRSDLAPWAYELSFVALLYQTGLVGIALYFSAIFWLFYSGLKLAWQNTGFALYVIPTLVALACFLLATATNPYLYAFDHLWTLFVPLMVINVFLLDRRKQSGTAPLAGRSDEQFR